jgi:hypothetical protein
VERKHCHVIELSLAIISHAALSLSFWADIFSSVVFLINRLPHTSSIDTPYYLLYNSHSDYSMLRTLGCLRFPLVRPYNHGAYRVCSLVTCLAKRVTNFFILRLIRSLFQNMSPLMRPFFHINTNLHNPMIHIYPLIMSYGCHHLSCGPSPIPCMYRLYQLYQTNPLLPQSLLLYLLLPMCNLFLLIILHHLHNHHIY